MAFKLLLALLVCLNLLVEDGQLHAKIIHYTLDRTRRLIHLDHTLLRYCRPAHFSIPKLACIAESVPRTKTVIGRLIIGERFGKT